MRLKNNMNKKYMQISIYVIVTCIIIYTLGLVAKNAPVIVSGLFHGLGQFFSIIEPVILGFIFAYLLDGVVTFFETKLKGLRPFRKWKSCRGLAVTITIFIIIGFISLIVTLLLFSITDQIRIVSLDDIVILGQQIADSFSSFIQMISEKLAEFQVESAEVQKAINNVSNYLMRFATDFVNGAVGSMSGITSFFTTFFFAIIITVYFLIDGKMIKGYFSKVSNALFSDRFNHGMKVFMKDSDEVFSGYIKGQLLDVAVMMILVSVTLSILKVKYGVLIGIFSGIGNLIPYCGPFIGYVASSLVCLVNGEYVKLFVSLIALVVVQAVDANIIGPKLLSNSIKVHPLLVIISLIIGSSVGGLLGMLLAVPIGALLKVEFNKFIDHRLEMKEKAKNL